MRPFQSQVPHICVTTTEQCLDVRVFRWQSRRGVALLATFMMMLVLSGLAMAVGVASRNSLVGGKHQLMDAQVYYIAEAGWQRARQQLVAENWEGASPANSYEETFGEGEYIVTILDNGDGTYTITSSGYIPNDTNYISRRQVIEKNLEVSSGGTNLATSATAAASSTVSGSAASNANDGSSASFWKANTKGSGEWLRLNFGSATEVNQVVIKEKQWITGITVEYSSDASSWTTVPDLAHDSDSSDTTWTIDFTATSAQYFRATFTASGANKQVSVNEYEAYGGGSSFSIDQDGPVTTAW